MAFVGIKLSDDEKQLWVDAANGQHLTLSEWIRRACDTSVRTAPDASGSGAQGGPGETHKGSDVPPATQADRGVASPPGASAPARPSASTAAARRIHEDGGFRGPDLKPSQRGKK